MKNIIKIAIISMLLIVLNLSLFLNCTQATNAETRTVYEIDYCDKVLTYRGTPIGAVYVVYEEDGQQYPAYCISPQNIGVGETDAYDVTVGGNITDVGLWRVIINGFPYKTIEELGVQNEREAYLATKQAIYCYINKRGTENYSSIGEAGKRTLNALNKILNDANNCNETKIPNYVDIVTNDEEWVQDKIDNKYVSKTYKIQNVAPITDYTVQISGENIPEGLIITDLQNNMKNTFEQNEQFKILIPINMLNNNGNFTINVQTKMETKPVLYGKSPNTELQDYALTVYKYEDTSGIYSEEYQKNKSQIKILKQDKESKQPLEVVEFELLNENKEVIYQNLITDKNGEIIISNILPGKYYLREVRTLNGYISYDEYIQIDIKLNEQINILINNSKKKDIEITEEKTNIEVSKEIKDVIEKKLPVTGM